MIIGTILIFIIFALSSLFGWSDAMHYYYKYQGEGKEKIIFNYEHEVWTAIRFLSFSPIWYIFYFVLGWWSLLGILATFFIFPFFHDGMYYHKTHKYTDKYYKKGWKDCTSVHKLAIKREEKDTIFTRMKYIILRNRISFNWKFRLISFIIGCLLFLEMLLKLHF